MCVGICLVPRHAKHAISFTEHIRRNHIHLATSPAVVNSPTAAAVYPVTRSAEEQKSQTKEWLKLLLIYISW
jgi:hypothetical protein